VSAAAPPAQPCLGSPLSARELQVVDLVAEGCTNVQAGRRLGLSPKTVKSHLVRIGAKLGTGDRAGIVGAAYETGQMRTVVSVPVPEGWNADLAAVAVRIARGMSNAKVGRELFLSEDAVKCRVRRLFAVLGVADGRAATVRAGLECGVLVLVPSVPCPGRRSAVAAPVDPAGSRARAERYERFEALQGFVRALPVAVVAEAAVRARQDAARVAIPVMGAPEATGGSGTSNGTPRLPQAATGALRASPGVPAVRAGVAP
jgi:DNA-binding CsgD family transcriptional regulator